MASPKPEFASHSFEVAAVPTPGADDLAPIADRLAQLGLNAEAIELFDAILRSNPENLAVRMNRKRAEEALRSAKSAGAHPPAAAAPDPSALLSQHLSGLGEFYFELGDHQQATQLFEFARSKNRFLHRPAVFLARIAIERNDTHEAIKCLEEARKTNPFSQEISSLLGTVYFAAGDYESSLSTTIDAMLLTGETEVEESLDFGDRIRLAWAEIEATSTDDLAEIVHQRRQHFDELREHLLSLSRQAEAFPIVASPPKPHSRSELSPYRRFAMLEDLDEDDVRAFSRALDVRTYEAGAEIFAEGVDSNTLYLIAKGNIQIRKVCSFGSYTLHTLHEGEVVGRMNFLEGRPHGAHAFAGDAVEVYCLPRSRAEDLLAGRRHIAVRMLLYFWRTLAHHIRESNLVMRTLLSPGLARAEMLLDEKRRADAEAFAQECNRKASENSHRGLDTAELRLLGTLAGEQSFADGELIFAEGDVGDKLYIVTSGKVQILRNHQRTEEILAVLGRGEVFGEMALVDDQPRSASARSIDASTRAIPIHKDTVENLVRTDQESAQQFISLICRILSKRLRDLDQTVLKWRILTGIG